MNAKFEYFVGEYIRAVEEAQDFLQDYSGKLHPLAAWHQKQIPQEGTAPGIKKYCFHGVGCEVELEDGNIVDFDYNSNKIGFNAWRLHLFAETKNHFKEYIDLEYVCGLLKEAYGNKKIICGTNQIESYSTCFLVD